MTKKTLKDLELDHNKLKEAFDNLQKKFDDLSGKYETLHVSYEKLLENNESFRCDKCEKTFSTKLDLKNTCYINTNLHQGNSPVNIA